MKPHSILLCLFISSSSYAVSTGDGSKCDTPAQSDTPLQEVRHSVKVVSEITQLDVDTKSDEAGEISPFHSESVAYLQITKKNQREVMEYLRRIRAYSNGSRDKATIMSRHIIDGINDLLKYGLVRSNDSVDTLVAKADKLGDSYDGIAVFSRRVSGIHLDLITVSPWHLGSIASAKGHKRYRGVGRAIIEKALELGNNRVTLEAASEDSRASFLQMGFKPLGETKLLVLEGEDARKFFAERPKK